MSRSVSPVEGASSVDEGSPAHEATPHPSTPQNDIVRPILLSLDGGGVKGLSTLLILQELMERISRENPPKPCDVFDMIGGTSIGGLIAIMLGRLEMSVADCIEAYQHISRQVFRPTFCSKYMPRVMRTITGRSMYDSQHLEDAIKDIIQLCGEAPNAPLETTDDGQCKVWGTPWERVFVCATQCLDRSQVQFRNYRDPVHHNRVKGIKIWEAARATSAAPTYFEPIKVGSHSLEFVDGGIGTNNPVFQTRSCARDLWRVPNNTSFDEQIHCLVSIGTGAGQGYSAKVLDMLKIFSSVLTDTEATASKFASSHEHLVKTNKYFRLTVPAGIGNIDLADTSKLEDISGRTFTYLKDNCSEQLDQCAKVLKRKYRPEKSSHSKRSRIDLVSFKTAGSGSGCGRGCRWIVLCLTIVALIIGIIAANVGPPPIDRSAPIVAVMGQTGVGKSALIKVLGGRHVSTGDVPGVGQTSKVSWYLASIDGRNVYLIDTPGFDDDTLSDLQILQHISKELLKNYQNGRLLSGIIYLHDMSHTRIRGTGIQQLDYLKLLLGNEAYSNCVLVTNRWNLDSPAVQAEQQHRHNALKQKYWKDMISGGSIAMQHDGSFSSARRIIYYLIDKSKILLYHQHERGNEKKSFWQTKAGTKARSDRELKDPTMGDFGKSEPGSGLWDRAHDWIWRLQLKWTHPVE
ncbi:PNPLA domain-containing protein [Fusarium keratoplasticum]|nr:PNPLA domain-containing protein [Fusarium keratoplasticum]